MSLVILIFSYQLFGPGRVKVIDILVGLLQCFICKTAHLGDSSLVFIFDHDRLVLGGSVDHRPVWIRGWRSLGLRLVLNHSLATGLVDVSLLLLLVLILFLELLNTLS